MKKIFICIICALSIVGSVMGNNIICFADDKQEDISINTIFETFKNNEEYFVELYGTDISSNQLLEIKTTIIDYIEIDENASLDNITDFKKLYYSIKWISNNINYGQDGDDNLAYSVFISKKGVCQGYANLFKVFAHIFNVPCLVVNGLTNFGAHAWNYFFDKSDDKWYICDPTMQIADDFEKVKDQYTQNIYCENYIPSTISPYLYKDNNATYWFQRDLEKERNGIAVEINDEVQEFSIPSSVPTFPNLDIKFLNIPINSTYSVKKIKTLTISDSIEYISNSFFNNFLELERIIVTNNPNYVQNGDMIHSIDLSQIFIPKSIKQITYPPIQKIDKDSKISNLKKLEKITFGNETQTIEAFAIENCENLKSIVLPSSIIEINDNAFINISKDAVIQSDSENVKQFAQKNNFKFQNLTINNSSTEQNNNQQINQDKKKISIKKLIIYLSVGIGLIFTIYKIFKSIKKSRT